MTHPIPGKLYRFADQELSEVIYNEPSTFVVGRLDPGSVFMVCEPPLVTDTKTEWVKICCTGGLGYVMFWKFDAAPPRMGPEYVPIEG